MKTASAKHSTKSGVVPHEGTSWSVWHWCMPVVFIISVVPAWVFFHELFWGGSNPFGSASTCILLGGLLVSSITDVRKHIIPNWVTYPGILVGLGINFFDFATNQLWREQLGAVGLASSVTGLLVLFLSLLVVFSLSGGGAGDVKLVGAIGSLMGVVPGAEAVCLSFVMCAGLVMTWSVLSKGPLRIVGALSLIHI